MKKGVLFLCPDTVMLIREREEKIMKKGHCGKMLLLFGAACMLMTGCGTKESSKMDTKDMTTRDAEFHTELFGENTYIFAPEDDPGQVAQTLDAIYEKQEADQFGEARYAIYFMPGEYDETIEADVGFYTQVAGLGELPTDTKLQSLQCTARWLCNFGRSVESQCVLQFLARSGKHRAENEHDVGSLAGNVYAESAGRWCIVSA